MDNLTNKKLVVLKNHRANKIEVAMVRDVDLTNITKVFCNWIRMQSSELKTIFKVYKVDRWIVDTVIDTFPKFVNKT